jgi:hypothetical protein
MKRTLIAITISVAGLLGLPTPSVHAQEFTAFVPGGAVVRDARLYETPPTGALQAAAREGNVLQAINPLAPARYGTGEKYVAYESSDPFKKAVVGQRMAFGIRLFVFEF